MSILEVEELSVEFAGFHALEDVSLSVCEGEFFVVFGESGCGKSTLFRCAAGLQTPTAGSVRLFNEDIHRLGGRHWMEMRRRIGVAIFGGALIKSLTVLENVLLPLQELGSSRARNEQEWMATLLERLGLEKLRDLRPAELSRGEIQRVGLARALILDPEILICDDIFSGLDWRTRQRLVEFLEELQKSSNLTVVVCTSLPEIGLKAADRMIVLEEGRCVASGTSAEIKQLDDPIIERVLLSHIEAMQSFGAFASATNSGERP